MTQLHSTQLLDQIDALVEAKTFGLDALDQIKKIKDGYKDTLTELAAVKTRLQDKLDETTRLYEQLQEEKEEVMHLSNVVRGQEALVKKGVEAIAEAEKHKAVAEAFKYSLEVVFKPATVRETVYQSIPLSQNYNGNTSVMPYHQETRTTKEEL